MYTMCSIGGGSVPASPVYAKQPEPVAEEPKMDTEDRGVGKEQDAGTRAKSRGTRALRTDLGINTGGGVGLGIPKNNV